VVEILDLKSTVEPKAPWVRPSNQSLCRGTERTGEKAHGPAAEWEAGGGDSGAGWGRGGSFRLHSPESVLFTKSWGQWFLGWALGYSMINENRISLLFGLQAKRGKRT
jgi:hypothetical protein